MVELHLYSTILPAKGRVPGRKLPGRKLIRTQAIAMVRTDRRRALTESIARFFESSLKSK